MQLSVNKRRCAELKDQLETMTNEIDRAQRRRFEVQKEIWKTQERVDNNLVQVLWETLGTESLIHLCEEYANLSFCVVHQTYFPRSFECLNCCHKTMTKQKSGGRHDWLWYNLEHTSIVNGTFHVLHEEHDYLLISHLRSLNLAAVLDGVTSSWKQSVRNLQLGFSRHHFDTSEWHCLIWSRHCHETGTKKEATHLDGTRMSKYFPNFKLQVEPHDIIHFITYSDTSDSDIE
jgi:hypothetical protein